MQSAGTPTALQLSVEMGQRGLRADGQDVALLRVEVLDSKSVVAPSASNNVSFTVLSGPASIIGVGNGDPSSHEPDRAMKRAAFNGLCQVILQAKDLAGTITLHAKSKGLTKGTLKIKARKGRVRKSIS